MPCNIGCYMMYNTILLLQYDFNLMFRHQSYSLISCIDYGIQVALHCKILTVLNENGVHGKLLPFFDAKIWAIMLHATLSKCALYIYMSRLGFIFLKGSMHKWMTKRQIFIFLQWANIKGDDNFELNDFGIVNLPMNYEKLFTHSSMRKYEKLFTHSRMRKYEKTDDFLGFWYWKLDQHKISFHIHFFWVQRLC